MNEKLITLSSNNARNAKVNMAVHRNPGRKPKIYVKEEPTANGLYNWVMDSSCTYHMKPFHSDFL